MREAASLDEMTSQSGSVSTDYRGGSIGVGEASSKDSSAAAATSSLPPASVAHKRAQRQEAAHAIATQQLIYFETGLLPSSSSTSFNPSSSSYNGPGISGAAAISRGSAGGGDNAWLTQKISLAQRLATGAPSTSPRALPGQHSGGRTTERPAIMLQSTLSSSFASDVLLPGMDGVGFGSQRGSSRLHDDDDLVNDGCLWP